MEFKTDHYYRIVNNIPEVKKIPRAFIHLKMANQGSESPCFSRNSQSQTPISMTSSSSEEEVSLPSLNSYDIVKQRANQKSAPRVHTNNIPEIDPTILSELEEQARIAARSLSKMTNRLTAELSDMTSVTKETVNLYETAVEDLGLSVDSNIRTMYGLMAKCEELNRKMKPVYEIEAQVQDIKTQLEILESLCK